VNDASPVVLFLRGKVPSKKNAYTPNKNGKGLHKSRDLQTAIDRLALQIPAEFRDLKLVSPDITFDFVYQKFNSDRDNQMTCLMDILVQYSVLRGDNATSCNGRITINPAVRGEYDAVTITIVPKELCW
jgi:hypothetical protein